MSMAMAAPVAGVGAVTTPRQPAPLTQSQTVAQQAIAEGATLPPSQVNPTRLNSLLEGFSGKQQAAQVASIKNQELINSQARKSLGLAPDTPITPEVLQQYRNVKGQAYDALRANPAYYTDRKFIADINKRSTEIQKRGSLVNSGQELELLNELKQLRFDGDSLVEKIKILRSDSDINFRSDKPEQTRLASLQKFAANQLEDLAERNLKNFNQPDVMSNFKQARQDIAKSYTIEKSLNAASGDVSGAALGRRAAAGKIVPQELQAVSNAAATFPTAFQNVSRIGSVPGISPLDVGAAGVAAASTANPSLLGAVVGRPLIRSAITSPLYQRNMLPYTRPRVPGLLNRITTDPLANYGIGMLPQYGVQ
jgi:hypothetical protein